ncbi:hypothetical protein AYI69_g9210 [Smittium culicis]|uniref:Uncharacterized protein n=1 Tax=Smittium culicis TaxID=133412 RepID=A0A1R1XE68_9FUNG|nr:hypothetical protein AYI69_g9210 [Smittium culicis]
MKCNIVTYISASLVAFLFFAHTSPIKSYSHGVEADGVDSILSSNSILGKDKTESDILDTDADKPSSLAFDISANDLQSASLSETLEGNNRPEIYCRRGRGGGFKRAHRCHRQVHRCHRHVHRCHRHVHRCHRHVHRCHRHVHRCHRRKPTGCYPWRARVRHCIIPRPCIPHRPIRRCIIRRPVRPFIPWRPCPQPPRPCPPPPPPPPPPPSCPESCPPPNPEPCPPPNPEPCPPPNSEPCPPPNPEPCQ